MNHMHMPKTKETTPSRIISSHLISSHLISSHLISYRPVLFNNLDDNRQTPPQSCTSLFTNRTSSPGLNAGSPIYGHPSHLNASPSAQFPHDPTLPCTVKSTSARSSACNLARLASALERLAASSALSRSARPQLQSLQARRRLVLGLQASAVREGCVSVSSSS
jgi:hypothetical protein